MKLKCLIPAILLAVTLSSCLKGGSNSTPEIYLAMPYVLGGDSLEMRYINSALVLDTVNAGDTVQFFVYLCSFYNNLTAFYLKESADGVTKIILPEKIHLDSIFNSQSDYSAGIFKMDKGSNELYLPFKYVALKKSNEAKLEMTVESDAKFDGMMVGNASNVRSVSLKTPIRE